MVCNYFLHYFKIKRESNNETVHAKVRNKRFKVLLMLIKRLAPDVENVHSGKFVPGLRLIENFVTEDQENFLLKSIGWKEDGKRQIKEISIFSALEIIQNKTEISNVYRWCFIGAKA